MEAITQQQTAAWKETRVGRFTASTFGHLMVQPRGKADREAGKFGATAMSLIRAKAIERLTGQWMHDVDTPLMRRGLLLEPAALHILNTHWRTVEGTTWQPHGANLGSTPDGLVDRGAATMDLKCPGNVADVVAFADDVIDGDFESLKAWDIGYAWQIMVQAYTCGVNDCWLVYFTDRLPIATLTNEERNEVQTLIDLRAEQHSQESLYPWSYTYGSEGYFFTARRFTLTAAIKDEIEATLERAEAECQAMMIRLAPILNMAPSPEHVEATVQELLEGSDVETEEAHDIRVLKAMIHHLQDMPWPSEVKRAITGHTIKMVESHVQKAMDMLKGTIAKDLR